jgi:L-cysteate sulfo-lyase
MQEKLDNLLNQKENFAFLPTPCHSLFRIKEILPKWNIWIKRDDMTGTALGGNKVRKLEYLFHDAFQKKSDVIVTYGGLQSNSCRQTAGVCAKMGIECYLVLATEKSDPTLEGNYLLNNIFGAKVIFCERSLKALESTTEELMKDLKSQGKSPYLIPMGGSNAIGCLGYVSAFKEILSDEKRLNVEFDFIIFASASYSTQAGLAIGNYLFSNNNKRILGIAINKIDDTNKIKNKILNLVQEFNEKYEMNVDIRHEDIFIDERFSESGYAIFTENDQQGIDLFAKSEGIILDPVYSGRAAGGLLKILQNEEIPENSNILFIHTGGSPAIFTELYKIKK